MPRRFVQESVFPVPRKELFAFHARPDAFALLQPPWERTEIVQAPDGLDVGTRVIVRSKLGPIWLRIVAEHVEYREGEFFVDEMRSGPFAFWRHRHSFLEHPEGSLLRDEIDYVPKPALLAWISDPLVVRPKLRKLFAYRHEATRRALLEIGEIKT
jgi:ligand-binding SRPBCC domain-containing protein